MSRKAPFPYFGGKRDVTDLVWGRLGAVKQYVEPFCGSAAMLLGAPQVAPLEVVNDLNGFLANFWRCVKHQPTRTAQFADYPVSHVDLGARHLWLLAQVERLSAELQDPDWPGDAKVAGWWLWGQCAWIGSGWCEVKPKRGKIPHVSDAGRGVQARGKVPHVSDALDEGFDTSAGRTACEWLGLLSRRLERVRLVHGSWDRCLNNHYGKGKTGFFLDPPYKGYEDLYGSSSVAGAVEEWAREVGKSERVALCGHEGDYDLPSWEVVPWSRSRLTYSGKGTKDAERIWFSPRCLHV